MLKFDNYVFFTLCEHSLRLFEKSHFSTYRAFCHAMGNTIKLGNFNKNDTNILASLLNDLKLIFGFKDVEAYFYIKRFFSEEKFIIYDEPVRLLREFYNFSIN
jgi:hypothetical protein